MGDVHKTYSLVLGIVLGIVGLWGFFSSSILGLFGVNALQSVLHLIAAGFGIYVGVKGEGHQYTMIIGEEEARHIFHTLEGLIITVLGLALMVSAHKT